MKNVLLVFSMAIMMYSLNAQVIPDGYEGYLYDIDFVYDEDKITYGEVVEVEGVSKKDLYKRAKLWISDRYKNPKDVLEIDDKEEGLLIVTGAEERTLDMWSSPSRDFWTTIKIEVKDGRYRYKVYGLHQGWFFERYVKEPIEISHIETKKRLNQTEQGFKSEYILSLQGMIDGLVEAMKEEGDDDW